MVVPSTCLASRGPDKKTRFDLVIDENTHGLIGEQMLCRKLSVNRVRGRGRTAAMNIYLVEGLPQEEEKPVVAGNVFFN